MTTLIGFLLGVILTAFYYRNKQKVKDSLRKIWPFSKKNE